MRRLTLIGLCVMITVIAFGQGTPASAAARRTYVRRAVSTYPPYVTRYPVPTLELNVPYHRQERRLSCEAATLRMVLLYRGIDEPEPGILDKMAVLPMNGDPNKGFVGNVDGTQHVTGYGIHAGGLASVANQYRPSSSFYEVGYGFLLDRLHENKPPIIWGSIYRNPADRSWTTSDGNRIQSVRGEHTWVVTGYVGPRSAPTHFITLDPIYGKRVFRTQDFLNLWGTLHNSGVIVD